MVCCRVFTLHSSALGNCCDLALYNSHLANLIALEMIIWNSVTVFYLIQISKKITLHLLWTMSPILSTDTFTKPNVTLIR